MLARNNAMLCRVANAMCITVIAYLLSLLITQPFSFSAGSLMSNSEKKDFNMTDFFKVVANSRPVSDMDTSVVLVDIGFTEREDVIGVLELLSDFEPAAVGLDATFNEKRPGDENLFAAIDRCPNLVMAVGVGTNARRHPTFLPNDYSYFYNQHCDKHRHGVINLPSKFHGATIRDFRPRFPIENADTLPGMALALAEIVNPEAAAKLRSRAKELETIDYPSRKFDIIPWFELPEASERVKGKAVLVGALGEVGDTHATPIDDHMDGVIIHALALSTILRGVYFTTVPKFITMGMGFLLCFLLCFILLLPKKSRAFSLWMRLLQLGLLYALIRIGYWLYIDYNVIFDFSYSLMMVVFGYFALDIWNGLCYYTEKVKNSKFAKRFSKHND